MQFLCLGVAAAKCSIDVQPGGETSHCGGGPPHLPSSMLLLCWFGVPAARGCWQHLCAATRICLVRHVNTCSHGDASVVAPLGDGVWADRLGLKNEQAPRPAQLSRLPERAYETGLTGKRWEKRLRIGFRGNRSAFADFYWVRYKIASHGMLCLPYGEKPTASTQTQDMIPGATALGKSSANGLARHGQKHAVYRSNDTLD